MYKLLIADDDEIIRTGIVNIFDWESIKITEIRAVDRAELVQEALEEFKADIVILDIMMQEMSGLDALSLIRENDPEIRVIIFSGFDDFKYAQTALKNGAYDYVL